MKRVIIIVLLIIAIVLGYQIVVNGFETSDGEVLISSYEQVESDSDDLASDIAAYNTLNDTQYNTMLTTLKSSINNYKSTKEEYEELIAELGTMVDGNAEGTEDEIVYVSPISAYEIDFLWTIIGNYAKSEGLVITMDINKSSVPGNNVSGYEYYNLSFSVTGQYINIANFLYDIEDDDRLSFEIRDFSMTSGAATFTIYSVPIDSETLMASNNNSSTITADDGTQVTIDGSENNVSNNVGNETVSSNSTNTTNDTNSSSTNDNSTNTDNSSNTTNEVNNTTN